MTGKPDPRTSNHEIHIRYLLHTVKELQRTVENLTSPGQPPVGTKYDRWCIAAKRGAQHNNYGGDE